ncbi:MAG: SulP family inorganic anion transporter, partial [Ruminococcus bromii]|nr:SulP family inorganic anion transporter [Ruminococcus bromii]
MIKNYVSMLKSEFKGYGPKSLLGDVMAGLTVCAVALPLALAFGVSCGADAAAGLITAILSGLVISALSGASFQISGPTGAMTAVLVTIIAKDGGELSGVFLVGLIAGALMLLAGILKLGKLVHLIPKPVITGFTSGIAVIIALGQIDNFFAVTSKGDSAVQKLLSYGTLGFSPDWRAVAIGLLVIAIMIVWPKKWNAKVPSSLVGIIVAAVAAAFLFPDIATVGAIPKTIFLENRLDFSKIEWNAFSSYVGPALTVAMLGMIESLLCGASASAMTKGHFDADIELVGQGVGNMIIPFFGGVPATAAIARTSVAIKSGCKTRLTGVFHAVFLLLSMFLLGDVMSRLPMAALAGVLMMTAWRMNEWHEIGQIFKRGFKSEIAQYLITLVATVVFDL